MSKVEKPIFEIAAVKRNHYAKVTYEHDEELISIKVFSVFWKKDHRKMSKMSKYGVFPSPYFPIFSPNTGKYGREKPPYLDTFHTVELAQLTLYFSKF